MSKGRYVFNEGKGIAGIHPNPQGASYKAGLCTMLIFIAMLLMVILFIIPLRSDSHDKIYNSNRTGLNEKYIVATSVINTQPSTTEPSIPLTSLTAAVTKEIISTTSVSKESTESVLELSTILQKEEVVSMTANGMITSTTETISDEINTSAVTREKSMSTVPKESTDLEQESITIPPKENEPSTATGLITSETTEKTSDEINTSAVTNEQRMTTVNKESTNPEVKSTTISPNEVELFTAEELITSEVTETTSDEINISAVTNEQRMTTVNKESTNPELKSTTISPKEEVELYTAEELTTSETTETTSDEIDTSTVTEEKNTTTVSEQSTDYKLESTIISPKEEVDLSTAEGLITSETTETTSDEINTSAVTEERSTTTVSEQSTDSKSKSTIISPKEEVELYTAEGLITSETTETTSDEINTSAITEERSTTTVYEQSTDSKSKSTIISPKEEVELYTAEGLITSETTETTSDEINTSVTEERSTTTVSEQSTDSKSKSTIISPKEEVELYTAEGLITSETTETTSDEINTLSKVCLSESCKITASRMLSLIDHTQDPCEDFYKFACGGLQNTPTLLEENIADDVSKRVSSILKNINDTSSIVYRKLKMYYQSCVDYDKNVPMEKRKKQGQDLFLSIGSMVVSGRPNVSLTELLIQLFHYGSAPLFDISLDVDSKYQNFTFVVTQPKWMTSLFKTEKDTTSHCRYKPDDSINSNLNKAYSIYIKCLKNNSKFFDNTEEAMEAFNVFDVPNATLLIQETVLAIERDVFDLIKFLPPKKEINMDLQEKAFKDRSVGQLWNNSLIEWGPLLEALFNVTVSNETTVQVYFTDYMDYLASELKKKDPRELHNALLGIFAHSLYTDLVKTNHPCDREQYCLRIAMDLMPQVVSNMYMLSFVSSDLKKMCSKTSTIFDALKLNMKETVRNSTWMDEKTKTEVLKKLDFITLWLPDSSVVSQEKLEHNLAKLIPNNYLIDSVSLTKIYQRDLYSRYKLSPHSAEAIWSHFLTSFSTKTLYIHRTNALVVPLSILTPLLDSSVPFYITMAKIGYHLAQGIARGFDPSGITYKWNGLVGDIISHESYEIYKTSVDISKELYQYMFTYYQEDRVYRFRLNTYQTLNSRLSDVTAAKLALETACKNGIEEQLPYANFTPHQTFHLILLQGFCTKRMIPESLPELFESDDLLEFLRVNYIAQNMEDFGTAFKCTNESKMNGPSRSEPFPLFSYNRPSQSDTSRSNMNEYK